MRLALFLPSQPNEMWQLGGQLGVTDAVTSLPLNAKGRPSWEFTDFLRLKQSFADAGLNATVLESSPPMDRIKLGLPGRDEEIEQVCQMLTNMGAAGINIWCYNFMAVIGWFRTSVTTHTRGGALVTSFDQELLKDAPLTEAGVVPQERLWENYAYFLERVLPIAERANVKLALHPDDPPIPSLRGIGRIFISVEALQRATEMIPSDYNGITFCQGTIKTMGADIPTAIRQFGSQKIHFVHFRDTLGTPTRFVETFHDAGPTDMLTAIRTYQEIGFNGPIRPDHVPTMAGDDNSSPGYTTRGRLYAIGYMRGLLEQSAR